MMAALNSIDKLGMLVQREGINDGTDGCYWEKA